MGLPTRAVTSRRLYGDLYCVWVSFLLVGGEGIIYKGDKEKNKICEKNSKEKRHEIVVTLHSRFFNQIAYVPFSFVAS